MVLILNDTQLTTQEAWTAADDREVLVQEHKVETNG